MNDQVLIRVTRHEHFDRDTVALRFACKVPTGLMVAEPIRFRKRDNNLSVASEPMIELLPEEAQDLFNQLWDFGFRRDRSVSIIDVTDG